MVCGKALGGAVLGGIHQGLVDLQLRHAVFPAHLVDKTDHLLPDLHVGGQVDSLFWSGRLSVRHEAGCPAGHGQRELTGLSGAAPGGDRGGSG